MIGIRRFSETCTKWVSWGQDKAAFNYLDQKAQINVFSRQETSLEDSHSCVDLLMLSPGGTVLVHSLPAGCPVSAAKFARNVPAGAEMLTIASKICKQILEGGGWGGGLNPWCCGEGYLEIRRRSCLKQAVLVFFFK